MNDIVLNEISKLENLIHLAGSRFVLDDLPATTDWDFIAMDTPMIRQHLEDFGWVTSHQNRTQVD